MKRTSKSLAITFAAAMGMNSVACGGSPMEPLSAGHRGEDMVCLAGDVGPRGEVGGNPIFSTYKLLKGLDGLDEAKRAELFDGKPSDAATVISALEELLKIQIKKAVDDGMPLTEEREGLPVAPGTLDLKSAQGLRRAAAYAGSFIMPMNGSDAKRLTLEPERGGAVIVRASKDVLNHALVQSPLLQGLQIGESVPLTHAAGVIAFMTMTEEAVGNPVQGALFNRASEILMKSVQGDIHWDSDAPSDVDKKLKAAQSAWVKVFPGDALPRTVLGANRSVDGNLTPGDQQIEGRRVVGIHYQDEKRPYLGNYNKQAAQEYWKQFSLVRGEGTEGKLKNTNDKEIAIRTALCYEDPKRAIPLVILPTLEGKYPGAPDKGFVTAPASASSTSAPAPAPSSTVPRR